MINNTWTQAELQSYISNETEEGLWLDYKAAKALGKSDNKKTEITKDVSAFANSDGGVIIYGITEFTDPEKKHLPERIDPINRKEFSSEWLQQVINNISPKPEVLITPVEIDNDSTKVVYVVEISKSTTAHQAKDKRYYKRFNNVSEAMDHYEIEDVMNRSKHPDISVEFSYLTYSKNYDSHSYRLNIELKNSGSILINNFLLEFSFPKKLIPIGNLQSIPQEYKKNSLNPDLIMIRFSLSKVIFPEEKILFEDFVVLNYFVDQKIYMDRDLYSVEWTLYADDMNPKHGVIPLSKLNQY